MGVVIRRADQPGDLGWIVQARTPPTRAKRVAETARLAAVNQRANQWRPKDKRRSQP